MTAIDDLQARAANLWRTKFPDADVTSHLKKLKSEVSELLADPDDGDEWGDVLLCLLIAAEAKGHDAQALIAFANHKAAICEMQEFVPVGDGTYRRVKTPGATVADIVITDPSVRLRASIAATHPQCRRMLSIRDLASMAGLTANDSALATAISALEQDGTLSSGRLFDDGSDDGVIFEPEDVLEAIAEGSFVHPYSGKEIALDHPRLLPWWRGAGAE